MFLGYAENVKGYRVFDLDASKVKVTRSVKMDEREVDGIYETLSARNGRSSTSARTLMLQSCLHR
ncbi:hypothetical protein PR002_g27536 [Phytophthora rubi]|nr:hypothetical protein PR002_g27536 [Phytophthora rubi]